MASVSALQQLYQATRAGNVQQFQTAAAAVDADVIKELRDTHQRSLLHYAAQEGHKDLCSELISKFNIDVNAQDEAGETALAAAAACGNEHMCELLLRAGADVSLRRENGLAPIHRGAACGRAAVIDTLLAAGAQLDMPSARGPPICCAAGAGDAAGVLQLLKHGADPNAIQPKGLNVLIMAAAVGSVKAVKHLIKAKADVAGKAPGGATALHAACTVQDHHVAEQLVELLLEAGADADTKDDEEYLAISIAIANGHREAVRLLLHKTTPLPEVKPWTVNRVFEFAAMQQREQEELKRRHSQQVAARAAAAAAGGASTDAPTDDDAPSSSSIRIEKPIDPDDEKAADLKRQADLAFVKQDFEGAAACYSQSLQHHTLNPFVWSNRAAANIQLGRLEEAMMDARKGRALKPEYAPAWYREGLAAARLKLWEEAATAFYGAARLEPGNQEIMDAFEEALGEARREYMRQQAAQTDGSSGGDAAASASNAEPAEARSCPPAEAGSSSSAAGVGADGLTAKQRRAKAKRQAKKSKAAGAAAAAGAHDDGAGEEEQQQQQQQLQLQEQASEKGDSKARDSDVGNASA